MTFAELGFNALATALFNNEWVLVRDSLASFQHVVEKWQFNPLVNQGLEQYRGSGWGIRVGEKIKTFGVAERIFQGRQCLLMGPGDSLGLYHPPL